MSAVVRFRNLSPREGAEERPQLLRHAAAIACIGLLQLAHPVWADEQSGPLATPSTDSAASSLSASAADDKTRLVRSQLLQDGASDVQPPSAPAPGAAVPSSSIVQGQGAPEPKPASPAPAEVSEPASANNAESRPAQSPSAQPSASSSAPAPLKESGAPQQNGSKSIRQEETEKEAKKLLDEEEERRKTRRRKKGRIRELEEIRAELAEKELVLLGKEQELLERDQSVQVLREELDLERKLRTLLTKEKEKAEEEAALAMGLCTGGSIF
ncbi:g4874 [Coccomyxa viridis]|uniref:G4874 protein n=1 Tax=Coccomyxa viridis TaxID=1274662 RepID=A0ABP1FRD2_9CHLO